MQAVGARTRYRPFPVPAHVPIGSVRHHGRFSAELSRVAGVWQPLQSKMKADLRLRLLWYFASVDSTNLTGKRVSSLPRHLAIAGGGDCGRRLGLRLVGRALNHVRLPARSGRCLSGPGPRQP